MSLDDAEKRLTNIPGHYSDAPKIDDLSRPPDPLTQLFFLRIVGNAGGTDTKFFGNGKFSVLDFVYFDSASLVIYDILNHVIDLDIGANSLFRLKINGNLVTNNLKPGDSFNTAPALIRSVTVETDAGDPLTSAGNNTFVFRLRNSDARTEILTRNIPLALQESLGIDNRLVPFFVDNEKNLKTTFSNGEIRSPWKPLKVNISKFPDRLTVVGVGGPFTKTITCPAGLRLVVTHLSFEGIDVSRAKIKLAIGTKYLEWHPIGEPVAATSGYVSAFRFSANLPKPFWGVLNANAVLEITNVAATNPNAQTWFQVDGYQYD